MCACIILFCVENTYLATFLSENSVMLTQANLHSVCTQMSQTSRCVRACVCVCRCVCVCGPVIRPMEPEHNHNIVWLLEHCYIYGRFSRKSHNCMGKKKFRKKSFQITLIIWGYKVDILSISEKKLANLISDFSYFGILTCFTGQLTLLQDVWYTFVIYRRCQPSIRDSYLTR